MTIILQHRAAISQNLEIEQNEGKELRKHVPIAIVKEILRATRKGWDASRISTEYKVDPSVIPKIANQFAVPEDNADGIVSWP